MKAAFAIISLVLAIALSLFIYFLPISTNFVRYLWWRLTTATSIVSGKVISNGTDIHYSVYGQGSPILMLHGGLSNKLSWFSQIPVLTASGYQLILLDARGHGLSALGNHTFSYRLLADDAMAVLDQLRVAQVDVIGWSDGANTALILAGISPGRIRKIVAISGNYSPQGLTDEAQQDNFRKTSGVSYWLYRWWTGAGEKFEKLEDRLKKMWSSGPEISDRDLKDIRIPVLIIVGDHDLVTVDHASEMAQLLPESTLHVVPGGGHATLITQGDEINELILGFLADNEGR